MRNIQKRTHFQSNSGLPEIALAELAHENIDATRQVRTMKL